MKYDVVTAGSPGELRDEVQKLADQGWRPVGGVCFATQRERDGYGNLYDSYWYHQAVTWTPPELVPY